jgi:hypothetical protein
MILSSLVPVWDYPAKLSALANCISRLVEK